MQFGEPNHLQEIFSSGPWVIIGQAQPNIIASSNFQGTEDVLKFISQALLFYLPVGSYYRIGLDGPVLIKPDLEGDAL